MRIPILFFAVNLAASLTAGLTCRADESSLITQLKRQKVEVDYHGNMASIFEPQTDVPHSLALIRQIPEITKLRFSYRKLRAADLAEIHTLKQIDELSLWELNVDAAVMNRLVAMPNLRKVNVYLGTISPETLSRTERLERLERLWIDSCRGLEGCRYEFVPNSRDAEPAAPRPASDPGHQNRRR